MVAPRQADGSLPVLPSFRLAAGSDLIDKGVDLKLPFAGAAPDLGAFEVGLEAPVATGGTGGAGGVAAGGATIGGTTNTGGGEVGGSGSAIAGSGGFLGNEGGSVASSGTSPSGGSEPHGSAGSAPIGMDPAASAAPTASHGDNAGCGCRVGGSSSRDVRAPWMLGLLLPLCRRRRRARAS